MRRRSEQGGRPWLATAVAGAVVVVLGLATARLGSGGTADALGDALYAALVLLLVALAAPRWPRAVRAGVAVALCWAVELLQLTGVPAAASSAWPPLRYLLGTTFVATDLLWYAVGVLVASCGTALASRVDAGRRPAVVRG
ncbi:ribosomal maturation YjgA family protein [Cellulomonas pakistanensis]|uniref:DUF2809 domain-containing protein n=1 Tax=Cellulomonas pakistanensis TaxID=992287 RepID=A0A919PFM2_9CELL|nr:DUF2809 domain-containing protein [Cellulomonas pakistanensis]GIG37657.1 hypothetical protein Cpa01nite_30380 [Cellulomonas pakistanensis]